MRPAASAREWLFYVAVGSGMALSTSAFAMVSGLFEITTAGPALLALVIGGAICIVIALSIGELASMWPSSPAVLTYFRAGFGPMPALVLIHLYLLFVILIAGVESYSFALVVRAAIPAAPPMLTIVVLLSAVVLVNLRGLELPRLLQIVTAYATMAAILACSLYGLGTAAANAPAHPPEAAEGLAGLAGLPAAIGLAVFIYTGFEWVTPVGLSRRAYERRIPVAMLIAIASLFVTYALFVAALGAVLPRHAVSATATPQVAMFGTLLGQAGVALALLLSLGAIFSTFNAGIMGGAQLVKAMGREGTLPEWVAWVNLENGAPIGAILLLGSLALLSSLIVAAFDLYLVVGVLGSGIICLIYACYVGAVERLRRTRPDHARPFRTRVPVAIRWFVVVLMPLIGLASLVTIPEVARSVMVGFSASLAVVAILAFYSATRHKRAAGAAGAERRDNLGELR